jgi:hypothetical protein
MTGRMAMENEFPSDYERLGAKSWALDLKD